MLRNIRHLVQDKRIWTEVTTLIIPGLNDSDDECGLCRVPGGYQPGFALARVGVSSGLPMRDRPPTPAATLRRAWEIGRAAGLRYVYPGNIWGDPQLESLSDTLLPGLRRPPGSSQRLPGA